MIATVSPLYVMIALHYYFVLHGAKLGDYSPNDVLHARSIAVRVALDDMLARGLIKRQRDVSEGSLYVGTTLLDAFVKESVCKVTFQDEREYRT